MDEDPVLPARLQDVDPAMNRLTYDVIGGAIEVQRAFGTGLLEGAYKFALVHELRLRGHEVRKDVPLDVEYKGLRVERAYLADLVVDDVLVVELKRARGLDEHAFAQVATYLHLTGIQVGLLINFRQMPLHRGLHRIVASPRIDD